MLNGFDYSYAQGTIDWPTTIATKPDFVYGRACYGEHPYFDDGVFFTVGHDACKAAGIAFGTYIFWLAWQDGIRQANNLGLAADGRYGTARPVIDVEEGSFGMPTSLQQRIDTLGGTSTRVQSIFGCQPIIYTNADTWTNYMGSTDAFAGHDFYIADFDKSTTPPLAIPGIKKIIMKQYSNKGVIAGITQNVVDLDVLYGDLSLIARAA